LAPVSGSLNHAQRDSGIRPSTFMSSRPSAQFGMHAPDFRDAKLREATEWHDARWPLSPGGKEAAQEQIYAYERLKAEMERQKKHEDEQFFFSKELHARRALLWFRCHDSRRPIGERLRFAFGWLLNAAYATFSGYGLSIGKPLAWLITLCILCALAFTQAPSLDGGPMNFGQAAEFTVINLLPFLPNKAGEDITKHLATWTKWAGNAESFLGLALRNRFRMK
jgi:hypothetical protein